jgi:hypothetical protein
VKSQNTILLAMDEPSGTEESLLVKQADWLRALCRSAEAMCEDSSSRTC